MGLPASPSPSPGEGTNRSHDAAALPRATPSGRAIVGYAVLVGVVGGLVATLYAFALRGMLWLVWDRGVGLPPATLSAVPAWRPAILLVTTAGGLIVGLLTRWLGSAGELAAVVDNIHLRHGRIDARQTPAMLGTSLAGIAAGGSAGPEAPLVQVIGSFASALGDRLRMPGPVVRTFTFCGMGAALGAFFGAPLGGALFALEIPHRRGIEYYESLLPALVASLSAFVVFRSIVGYEAVLFHLPGVSAATLGDVGWGAALGALGAAVAWVFSAIFGGVGRVAHRWSHRPVLLGLLGGLSIGVLAQAAPLSLFWGEFQIDRVANLAPRLLAERSAGAAALLLLGTALAKMLAISFTLHGGFRGGFIFPLMFVGAAVGVAAGLLVPGVPMWVAVLAAMAAVNVSITKTPVSTCVILASLTGAGALPVLTSASVVSLLLASRLNLIRTQRSRVETDAVATASRSDAVARAANH